MLALSPLFSTAGWPVEDPTIYHDQMMILNHSNSNDNNYGFKASAGSLKETPDYAMDMGAFAAGCCLASSHDHPHDHDYYHQQEQQECQVDNYNLINNNHHHPAAGNNEYEVTGYGDDQYSQPSSSINVEDPNVVKKMNHNASERERRKKINDLYSSLRDLLPNSDHSKKLSIPATVSRVLKYIPDLQQQVETLIRKKEELSPKTIRSTDKQGIINGRRKGVSHQGSLCSVSATQLGDTEIVVHISTSKALGLSVSEVLMQLERYGLTVLNVSSFEPFGGQIFHNIHLWMDGANAIKCELLSEKILSLYQNKSNSTM